MTVYIENIFIENLIMNYLLLYQTSSFIKERVKKIKLFLSALVGAIYVCIMVYIKLEILNYAFSKILLSFVMVYICFIPKEIRKYIKMVLYFYLISVINVGTYLFIINIFNITISNSFVKIIVYTLGAVIVWCIDKQMWKMFKLELKKQNFVYDVYIPNEKKYIKYKGFIDTGNTSKHMASNRMIFYANKKKIELSNFEKVHININTVNNVENMEGYLVDNVIIKNKEKLKFVDIVICFSKEDIKNNLGCDMIMNYEVYEEILGGIHI